VRPAIDPLFRSAAASYGPRVVGIVLTGLRDDGTAGLHAIQRSGGLIAVQDPDDALHPQMPLSAMRHLAVDHVMPLAQMGELICRLAKEKATEGVSAPADVLREARIDARYGAGEDGERAVDSLGNLTTLDCPECGGPLWQLEEGPLSRFRCRIGHAFSERALAAGQTEQAERSLLVALRTLEERSRMLHRLAEHSRRQAFERQAERFARDRDETLAHADVLRGLLALLQ
jgi:two-component system chemotaxis response regulator CheB